jgi:hypothetical protein
MPNDDTSGPSNPPSPSKPGAPSPTASTGPAAVGGSKGKGGTRPKKDDATTLKDARAVLLAVKKNAKAFVAADKDRQEKRIDAPWIAAFDAAVKQAATARGGQRPLAVKAAGVTTQEIAARDAVYGAAAQLRDDIATNRSSTDELKRAFGVGAAAKSNVTSSVLGFADAILSAYQKDEWQPQAVKAGLTPKKIAALQALRDELAGFEAQRAAEVNDRAAATQAKDAAIASVRTLTAYARQVAKSAFRNNPKALRAFASRTARSTPKPRTAAKKAPVKPKKRAHAAPPRRGRAKKKSR